MAPRLLRTAPQVRAFRAQLASEGRRLALVPTMGALHDGHVSLMEEGKRRADVCAATIFVNPAQFGPKEDLSRYPRDLEGDLAKCQRAGVEVVFAPEPAEIYPPGFQTYVEVTQVSQGLCGERRPGHFKGVATVVTKLLSLFRPQLALFGEKDYQQLQVIRALSRDLELGVEIVGMPTVREPDGLAMSSRNAYLNPDERQRALCISRGLFAAKALSDAGETQGARLKRAVRDELSQAKVREDYLELVDADTLTPVTALTPGRGRLLVAGYLGTTRLIDNLGV